MPCEVQLAQISIDALREIEDGCLRLGRQETLDALLPGIEAEQVRAILAKRAFASSRDVETWFGWKNGTSGSTIGISQMMPGYYPLSAEESVSTAATFQEFPSWEAAWLPLLADGGGYFYVLDQSVKPVSPVRRFRYDQTQHPIEYASLSTFLSTIAEAYRRSAFTSYPDGYIEVDRAVYDRIAALENPGVEWWL